MSYTAARTVLSRIGMSTTACSALETHLQVNRMLSAFPCSASIATYHSLAFKFVRNKLALVLRSKASKLKDLKPFGDVICQSMPSPLIELTFCQRCLVNANVHF